MSTHNMGTLQEHWYEAGAAVAFGLMGMAIAIRETYGEILVACEKRCGGYTTSDRAYCDACEFPDTPDRSLDSKGNDR